MIVVLEFANVLSTYLALSHVLWMMMLNVNVRAPKVKTKDYFVVFWHLSLNFNKITVSFSQLPLPQAFSEGPINRKMRRCICFCWLSVPPLCALT